MSEKVQIVLDGDKEIIDKILRALKDVYDPEIPVNVYDLGLIYEIRVRRGGSGKPKIYVLMTLTAPGCPVAGVVAAYVEEAIKEAVPDAEDVEVEITFDPLWSPERVTDNGRELLKSIYGYDVVEEWKKRWKEMEGSYGTQMD